MVLPQLILLPAFAVLVQLVTADVTIIPAGFNLPLAYNITKPVGSAAELLSKSAPFEVSGLGEQDGNPVAPQIVISSFSNLTQETSTVHATSDSFVRGAIEAWGQHQHLVIRPDEVWFQILVQLNYWMNAHADDVYVRRIFVNTPPGTKEEIHVEGNTWYDAISKFRQAIQDRIKAPWFKDWITPNWSTSTESDEMTANVLMMSLTQKYFTFSASIICGLPSVTLLGTREDWLSLSIRLDRMKQLGAGPGMYAQQLRPILSHFITSFESPNSKETREFWASIVHAKPGKPGICGVPAIPYYITGWITGFLYWNFDGEPLIANDADLPAVKPYQDSATDDLLSSNEKRQVLDPDTETLPTETQISTAPTKEDNYVATLDGVTYPTLPLTSFPVSYAKVPLKLENKPAYALAGLIATSIKQGSPANYISSLKSLNQSLPSSFDVSKGQNTYQPLSGWFVYLDPRADDPEVPPGTGGFKGPTTNGVGPPRPANLKPKISSEEVQRLATAIASSPVDGVCERPDWFRTSFSRRMAGRDL